MRGTKKRNSEYVNLDAYRWALSVEGLAKNTRSLFLELARRSDEFGCCHISRAKVADVIGCSKRTIDTHFSVLIKMKLIRRIGRYTAPRGQITSITHVSAWPDRARIPPAGHPKYGMFIKENPLDAVMYARSKMQDLQGAGEENSDYGIPTNKSTTTTEGAGTALLEQCLDALGPWANESNRGYLRRRPDTLTKLLDMGFGLETDVLPVLKKMGKREGSPPNLRSWLYFADPIRKRAEARKEKQTNSGTDDPSTNERPAIEGNSAPHSASTAEQADLAREMDRFLRSVATSKRAPKTGDDL